MDSPRRCTQSQPLLPLSHPSWRRSDVEHLVAQLDDAREQLRTILAVEVGRPTAPLVMEVRAHVDDAVRVLHDLLRTLGRPPAT